MFMHPEDIYSFEKARHQELTRQLELARRARAANRSEGHRPRRTIAFARRRWSAFIGLFNFHIEPLAVIQVQDTQRAAADGPRAEVTHDGRRAASPVSATPASRQ